MCSAMELVEADDLSTFIARHTTGAHGVPERRRGTRADGMSPEQARAARPWIPQSNQSAPGDVEAGTPSITSRFAGGTPGIVRGPGCRFAGTTRRKMAGVHGSGPPREGRCSTFEARGCGDTSKHKTPTSGSPANVNVMLNWAPPARARGLPACRVSRWRERLRIPATAPMRRAPSHVPTSAGDSGSRSTPVRSGEMLHHQRVAFDAKVGRVLRAFVVA